MFISFIITCIIYISFSALSKKFSIYRITNDNQKLPKFVGGTLSFSYVLTTWLMYLNRDYLTIDMNIRNPIIITIGLLLFFIIGYVFDNNQIVAKKKIFLLTAAIIVFSIFTPNINLFNFANIENAMYINYGLNLLFTICWYELLVNSINVFFA